MYLGMTQDQWMGVLRQILPLFGGVLVTLGLVSQGTINHWIEIAMTIVGPLMTIAGIVWQIVANNKKSILTSAANMPEVKKIELKSTESGKELERVTPSNVNTQEGT